MSRLKVVKLKQIKDMAKYSYECKKCGEYHPEMSIFYHLIQKRRMKKGEVNNIGFSGFGKIYTFARYCPKTKEYTIKNGFIS